MQSQQGVRLEIFIGCHGFSPGDVSEVALEGGAVHRATIASFPSDALFGDVLRDLSARATTTFVAKWDDDDLYGPHHVFDLWMFRGSCRGQRSSERRLSSCSSSSAVCYCAAAVDVRSGQAAFSPAVRS